MHWRLIGILMICSWTYCWAQEGQIFAERPIYKNGSEGYECYRIPAIIKATNGDLLAFAEGRVDGCNDFGDVDIVLKRSKDNGLSWSPLVRLVDNGALQSGNPAPLLDRYDPLYADGRLILLYNNGIASEHLTRQGQGLRTVHYITSNDHGQTWSLPTDITLQVHRPKRPDINKKYDFQEDWRSYALTPGHAIQLEKGAHAGRLFVPANHSEGTPLSGFNDYRAHALYSDDYGHTWTLSPSVEVPSSNESIAVELSDGTIMQNIRHQNGSRRERLVAMSEDGGESWSKTYFDTTLISPVCQASMINYKLESGHSVVLFSNPESRQHRERMTVKMSFDDGLSWPVKRLIRDGESAYSDLVIQEDGLVGLLYEHGNNGGIHYAHFNLPWLLGSHNNNDQPWMEKIVNPGMSEGTDFQLSPPIAHYASSLFADNAAVRLELDYPGRQIHYTLDGSTPNRSSPVYADALHLTTSCILSARAYHPEVRPSQTVTHTFVKARPVGTIEELKLSRAPDQKYPGGGAASLFDLQKGSLDFRSGKWMGYNGGDIEMSITLEDPQVVERIKVSMLSAHGSWIFLPKELVLQTENFTERLVIDMPPREQPSSLDYLDIQVGGRQIKQFDLIIKGVDSMPQWHQGQGLPAWMFIDEIIIE